MDAGIGDAESDSSRREGIQEDASLKEELTSDITEYNQKDNLK
jgi:hypothetical protein